MNKGNSEEYGKVAQRLHWLMAFLIFLMSLLGLMMSGQPASFMNSILLNLHILGGFGLAVLTLARLFWKWFDKAPDHPDQLSQLNLLAYKGTHLFIYVSLILMVTSGITMALSFWLPFLPWVISNNFTMGRSTLFLFHKLIFVILWSLIIGHICGVLYYQFRKSDVLSRMGLNWFVKP